jgi:hypothetical protein
MQFDRVVLLLSGAVALIVLAWFVRSRVAEPSLDEEIVARDRALELCWGDVSQRTGLRLLRASPYGIALHGVLDGVPVWFAQFAIRDGHDLTWGVRAELPQHSVALEVVPATSLSPEMHERTIPTGDDEFDLVYALRSEQAVDAFHALSRAARQALLVLGPARLQTGPGTFELAVPFAESELDDARIIAALELVRALSLPPKAREQTVQ